MPFAATFYTVSHQSTISEAQGNGKTRNVSGRKEDKLSMENVTTKGRALADRSAQPCRWTVRMEASGQADKRPP